MSKLYVAKMVMIKPLFLFVNGAVKIKSEDILVKKTVFGYREVLTGRKFIKGTYLEDNEGTYNSATYPYKLCNASIIKKLENGQTQFLIDDYFNTKSPIREAEKKDVQTIVDNFENSILNQYYKDEQVKRERKEREKRRMKDSIREAKQLVKERKYKK